jgi:hypothetical protein
MDETAAGSQGRNNHRAERKMLWAAPRKVNAEWKDLFLVVGQLSPQKSRSENPIAGTA